MYLAYYGLLREPFHTTPDPHFLFLSPSHKEALGAIIYSIEKRKGFAAIIGEVGTGKTSIIRAYLERKTSQKQKTIYIFNPALSFHELLIAIFRGLELAPRYDNVTEMVNQLHEVLILEFQAGGTVVVVIDEAQNMPLETLENLRMLSNLETSTDKLIQIILLGQPELDSLLKQPALRQFQQRIAIWATICPLTEEESRTYIEHRIERATTTGTPLLFTKSADTPLLFTRNALNLIVRQAQGIPRRINILCDNALITGYGRQCKPVSVSVVKEIIGDVAVKKEVIFSSNYLKWAMGISAAIIVILGIIFFFDSSFRNHDVKTQLKVNQVNGQASPIDTNTNETLSDEAGQTTQVYADRVLTETPNLSIARDNKNLNGEQEQTIPGNVDPVFSGESGGRMPQSPAEKPSSSIPGQVVLQSEFNGTGTPIFQKTKSSVQQEESLETQPVPSSQSSPHPDSTLVVQTDELFLEKGAMQSIRGGNITRVVKEGESLSRITIEAYGSENLEYLEWVKHHNPQVVNPDFILPGQILVLPEYSKDKVSQ